EFETRPPRRLLLEKPPGFLSAAEMPAGGAIRVEHFGLNSYRLRVDSPVPALLSASETKIDGWTATVNGRLTPILLANYAFRAIEVPAGQSLISMYPVGTALAALPVYVPVYAFLTAGGKPDPHVLFVLSEYAEKFAAATITAFAVWMFWLTVRRILPQRHAFWMAIAFGL